MAKNRENTSNKSLSGNAPKKSALNSGTDKVHPKGMPISPSEEGIYEINTDGQVNTPPEESLEKTRQNRVTAILGDRSELVTLFVQAYNRLDKTKTCLESILNYTKGIDFELILLDNGSTDGTLDFFKQVPYDRKKIYHVSQNVGSLAPAPHIEWSGRYIVYIPADTYVTKNWLTNLLTCVRSDPKIGVAAPIIFNVDHNETPTFTFSSYEEMQEKAAKHNISDPRLWYERLIMEPSGGVYKREALDIAGKISDYGFFHSSSDYDLAFRIRRAGYKTILCQDTYVHHDHPRTNLQGKDLEDRSRDLRAAARDFEQKYFGINGWIDGSNFETILLSTVDIEQYNGRNKLEILGIDVRCGAPILELKNKLQMGDHFDTRLSAFTTDPKYWLDLKTICVGEVTSDRIEYLSEHFTDTLFDFILLGRPINTYAVRPVDLLNILLKKIKPDGHLLIKLRNTYDVVTTLKSLGANLNVGEAADLPVWQINIEDFNSHVNTLGYQIKKISVENWSMDANIQDVVKRIVNSDSFSDNKNEVLTRILTRDYVLNLAR